MTVTKICLEKVASCRCTLEGDHEVHVCECGGSWKSSEPDFEVVTMPKMGPALAYLLSDQPIFPW